MAEAGPDTTSSDWKAMEPFWAMVEAILGGAATIRAAGEKYLPKFPNESALDYDYRRKNAKFTNVYRDIVENLAAKPFAKEVALRDGVSEAIKALCEDIDGRGNHLHVVSATLFFAGINDAVSWIFVDKAPLRPGATIAEEKAAGARPYWVHVPAKRLLAIRTAIIGGKEEIVHARIHEPETVAEGYGEKTLNRIRELNRLELADRRYGPATFTVWEEQTDASGKKSWVSIEEGAISIGVIALVPFITGRRIESTWRFVPPMQDAAYLQIEHFQQETNLKSIKEQAAFPMLAGNGVTPPKGPDGQIEVAPVGPKTVLYAPPMGDSGQHGEWAFIEPTAASLKFLADDVTATEKQLRELGRQPLTAQTGNLTVVTTAFAAQKGNSAIQAWCLNLKDALEQALKCTAMWLADTSDPEVVVYTDFAIELESDKAPDFLLAMRKGREISREALIDEAKRRGFLSAEYDAEEDMKLILAELPGDDDLGDGT